VHLAPFPPCVDAPGCNRLMAVYEVVSKRRRARFAMGDRANADHEGIVACVLFIYFAHWLDVDEVNLEVGGNIFVTSTVRWG